MGKWYHEGIPDTPADERETVRKDFADKNHCLECTAMSGCYFIDGIKTFPVYPHHPHCHCKKLHKKPVDVIANCAIEKFTKYIFSEKYGDNGKIKLFKNSFGYRINDSDYLKSEFDKQAKEKYISGDYTLGKLDKYGQHINISIELHSPVRGTINIVSGWMIRPNGLITCNTPLGDR